MPNPWDFEQLKALLEANQSRMPKNALVNADPTVGPLKGLELMNPPAMPPAADRIPAAQPVAPPRAQQQMMPMPKMPDRITPEDEQKLRALFDSQQGNVNQMSEAADKYESMPDQVNLQPLLNLADSWTGSSMAKGYQPPTTPEERMLNTQKLRALANQEQNALTKDRISVHNAGNKDEASMLRALVSFQATQANRDIANNAKNDFHTYRKEQDLQSQLTKEIEKPLEEQLEHVQKIDSGLASKDYQQVWGSLSNLARLMGEKGVLTNEDIRRLMPANIKGTGATIRAFFNTVTPTTELPEDYVKGLQAMVSNAKKIGVARYKSQLGTKRKKYEGMGTVREMMAPGGSGDTMFRAVEDRLKEVVGAMPDERPKEVDQKDWEAATPQEREALIQHFGGMKK